MRDRRQINPPGAAGDLSGDKELKREGKVDRAEGGVKDKVGDAADKVKDALRRD